MTPFIILAALWFLHWLEPTAEELADEVPDEWQVSANPLPHRSDTSPAAPLTGYRAPRTQAEVGE